MSLRTLVLIAAYLVAACDSATTGRGRPPEAEAPQAGSPSAARKEQPTGPWQPLERDHLHDPDNPALALLQEPAEALSVLPRAQEGNHVDWVAALRSGLISPRTNIHPETKITVIDLDVIMEETAGMPLVRFPHRPHTEWLDCSNCHDKLFIPKRGANKINMLEILNGNFCGQCHGAVSFPLTQCLRCHSVPRSAVPQGASGVEPSER